MMVEERELSTVPGKVSTRVHLAQQVNEAMSHFYEQTPDNLDVQNSYAQTSRVLANLFRQTGHFDKANQCFEVSKTLLESVVSAGGEESEGAQLELAHTLIDEATGRVTEGKIQAAVETLRRAREIADVLSEADPGNNKVLLTAARANNELANCHFERSENEKSLESAQLADLGFEKVLKTSKSFQNVALRINSLHARAKVHAARSEFDQAIEFTRQAVALAAAQMGDHPTNDHTHFALMSKRMLQEHRLASNENASDIGPELLSIRQGYERLVKDYAGFSIYKRHLARSLLAEATWAASQNDLAAAIEFAKQAAEIVEPYAAKLAVATYRSILADAYALQASLLKTDKQSALAAEIAAKAIQVQHKLSSDYSESTHQAMRLAKMKKQLAELLDKQPVSR